MTLPTAEAVARAYCRHEQAEWDEAIEEAWG